MIYVILIAYIAFTFWGSLIGVKTKYQTPESYFLANRNLKTLSLFFTILATNFSAFYFLGFASEGYRIGYTHYTVMALGTALAALSFIIIGCKVWKEGKAHGYITPSELIYAHIPSKAVRYLFTAIMIVFTFPYLALQIVGGGYILENLTNGDISYNLSVILLTLFTIVYVVIGGMQSVAKTDLKQGLLAFFFMTLAVVLISAKLGGLSYANEQVAQIKPELFSPPGGSSYPAKKWFSFMLFWFFCVPMFPQLFMRFYIAKDLKTLKRSALLYATIPIFISILPVFIGVLGHLSFPGLEGKAADQILPMMLVEHVHPYIAALVMTGAIAAFMSTLDSQLLALSTMSTRDIYIPLTGKQLSLQKEVFIGRIMVALFAVVGLIIAFNPFDTIFDMGKLAFSSLAVLFPLTLSVTRFGPVRPVFAILSMLSGLLTLFGFYYGFIPTHLSFGFEPFIIAISMAAIFIIIGRIRFSVQNSVD